ncbi:MAG: leucine-rich repeat domain-containing protein, partial [Aphanocapsa feldmannii 288cV]
MTLSHSASGGDYGSVTANLHINVQNICERMDALSSNGKTCNLSSKKITSLNSGDFDGLSNLQKLYLNNNKLSGLPEDVFNGLSKLRNLRLSNNDLSSLPEDIFAGLSKLQN